MAKVMTRVADAPSSQISCIKSPMQWRPTALEVSHVDVYPRVREQELDELQRCGIDGSDGEVKDCASEPVAGVDIGWWRA